MTAFQKSLGGLALRLRKWAVLFYCFVMVVVPASSWKLDLLVGRLSIFAEHQQDQSTHDQTFYAGNATNEPKRDTSSNPRKPFSTGKPSSRCPQFIGEMDLPLCDYRYRQVQFAGYIKAKSYEDDDGDPSIYVGFQLKNPISGWFSSGKYIDVWRFVVQPHLFLQFGLNLAEGFVKTKGGVGVTLLDRLSIGVGLGIDIWENHLVTIGFSIKRVFTWEVSKTRGVTLSYLASAYQVFGSADTSGLPGIGWCGSCREQIRFSIGKLSQLPLFAFLQDSITVGVAVNWDRGNTLLFSGKGLGVRAGEKNALTFYFKLNPMRLNFVSRHFSCHLRQASVEPPFALQM